MGEQMLAAKEEMTGRVMYLIFTSLRMTVSESCLQRVKKSLCSPALLAHSAAQRMSASSAELYKPFSLLSH